MQKLDLNQTINDINQNETLFISQLTDGKEVEITVNNIYDQMNEPTRPYGISYLKLILK